MDARFSTFQESVCAWIGLALVAQDTVADCERVGGQLQKPLAVDSGNVGCLQPRRLLSSCFLLSRHAQGKPVSELGTKSCRKAYPHSNGGRTHGANAYELHHSLSSRGQGIIVSSGVHVRSY